MTLTKKNALREISVKLQAEGVLASAYQVDLFFRKFRQLKRETVVTLADLVRYNFTWLYGWTFEFDNHAFRWLRVVIESNRVSLASCDDYRRCV